MMDRERLRKPGWKLLGALFLVAIIMTAAWAVRAGARQMAFFRVRTVEVRGVRYRYQAGSNRSGARATERKDV